MKLTISRYSKNVAYDSLSQGLMLMSYSIVMIALGLAAILSGLLAERAWRGRETSRGVAISMTVMMLVMVFWIALYTLEIAATTAAVKEFADRAKFLGIVAGPVAWFVFAMQYNGRTIWATRQR